MFRDGKETVEGYDGDSFEIHSAALTDFSEAKSLVDKICAGKELPPNVRNEMLAKFLQHAHTGAVRIPRAFSDSNWVPIQKLKFGDEGYDPNLEPPPKLEPPPVMECVDALKPFTNLPMQSMPKFMEYCKKHAEYAKEEENRGHKYNHTAAKELKLWDSEFLKVDTATLVELNLMANNFDIKSLLSSTGEAIAELIKDKSPGQIRNIFHIVNDFTGKEEVSERELLWLHHHLIYEEPEEKSLLGNQDDQEEFFNTYWRKSLNDLDQAGSLHSISIHLTTYDMGRLLKVSRKMKRVWIEVLAERIKVRSGWAMDMEEKVKGASDMCRLS